MPSLSLHVNGLMYFTRTNVGSNLTPPPLELYSGYGKYYELSCLEFSYGYLQLAFLLPNASAQKINLKTKVYSCVKKPVSI
jgi:hypothetical protein